jgi:F-type H+-transporting ATPase subunit b
MTTPIASGSFLVQPGIGLMVWTLVIFVASFWILRKYAFPRIGEALDKRQHAIEDSIDEAAKLREEAKAVLGEYRERLTEARAQADEIVMRARKAGDAAHKVHEEMLEQARRDIQAETARAISELRNEVADLTILATEKVTRKTLDTADQRRLVDEALNELDFSALGADRSN